MADHFGSLVFTPAVKKLQERYGSRRQYERLAARPDSDDGLGPEEREFISERDSFYIATIGSTGWPYVQHRGGHKGFLKVVDEKTIAFGDFRGNKQYVTTGNLLTDQRAALILVDYPRQARLKILGEIKVVEAADAGPLVEAVRDQEEKTPIERVYTVHVQAFSWNCPQHITPRFTTEEIRSVLEPFEQRLQALETENARLRTQLAGSRHPIP